MLKFSPEKALVWLREQLPGPTRIYTPGCSGEALIFTKTFKENPALAKELTFLGIWIPGINRVDYASLHPTAKSELIFLSSDFRESFVSGHAHFRPLSYTQAWPWLENTPLDAAIIQVGSPDKDGLCSLGVSADFTPAIMHRPNIIKIAHINPTMPTPQHSPKISLNSFDAIVEEPAPLLTYPMPKLSPVFDNIATNIAQLINDGDTLQFGLGNVQYSIFRALHSKKNLRIHSGMIADPVMEAITAGILDEREDAITTGVALGSEKFYDFVARQSHIQFAPVQHTHILNTLNKIPNFTAINSVIEVDLFGQANAEYINGMQISGTGGLVDFLRGAASAPNGKPILALASTAKNGTISRIVPKLKTPTVSINRADTGFIVTEHGIADVRGLSVQARAEKIINIANPDHRTLLQRAWADMREGL